MAATGMSVLLVETVAQVAMPLRLPPPVRQMALAMVRRVQQV
jgi:hypothetical protein